MHNKIGSCAMNETAEFPTFSAHERDAYELDAVHKALDVIISTYIHANDEKKITKADIARRISRDPSFVSRILNGRSENLTIKTVALLLRAMDHRLVVSAENLSCLKMKGNYGCIDDYLSDVSHKLTAHVPSKTSSPTAGKYTLNKSAVK